MEARVGFGLVVGGLVLALVGLVPVGCGEPPPPTTPPAPPRPTGPVPTLLMPQARFLRGADNKPIPQPATLIVLQDAAGIWLEDRIVDPESNVFHKAIGWRDGVLTIAGDKARLVWWSRAAGTWTPKVLWTGDWGGDFDRLRDIEHADFDGDGDEELVIATHDYGVVAVGDEKDGAWTFQELDAKKDTFVHEIEIGDVDHDGKKEFYATPSDRNRADGTSQQGGVVRYDRAADGTWTRSTVVSWAESHAKEILVADLDRDGTDELYAVREAHAVKDATGNLQILDPVRIVRLTPSASGWTEGTVATLASPEQQCRFLVPGDVDGDGATELVAAGYKTGLWVLEPKGDGSFTPSLVDARSSGFEHATHVADLNGDGTLEIYVASDVQGELRRYTKKGDAWERTVLTAIPKDTLTWNLQDMRLPLP